MRVSIKVNIILLGVRIWGTICRVERTLEVDAQS